MWNRFTLASSIPLTVPITRHKFLVLPQWNAPHTGKPKSAVIFQFKINLQRLGFREKLTKRLSESQVHIKQKSSYCQTVDIFIYFLTFKIPSSKYWAYGDNSLHISHNRKKHVCFHSWADWFLQNWASGVLSFQTRTSCRAFFAWEAGIH